jgi:hypothetical protein
MHEEGAIRNADHPDPGQATDAIDDLLPVHVVARVDGDVPDDPLPVRLDEIDGTDIATGLSDR